MNSDATTRTESRPAVAGKPIGCVTGTCPLSGRFGRLIWALAIAALVYAQWPILKGLFYKATGTPEKESSIPWRDDLPAALAEAEATGRPVLVDFTASWCPPCVAMKHDVWPDSEVEAAVAEGYVPVLIDVDAPGGAEAAARYGVGGIPAVLVVGGGGEVLRREGFMTRGEAIEFLGRGT